MGIADYVSTWNKGQKVNDTLVQKMFEGYVALGKAITGDDGLVDKTKLKQKEAQVKAAEAFYKSMTDHSLAVWGSTITDPEQQMELAYRTFGFGYDMVEDFIENAQQNVDPVQLIGSLQQNSAYNHFEGRNQSGAAKSKLKPEDTDEAIRYTKIEGRVDKAKLTIDDLAALLTQYIKDGVISDRFLSNKRYAIRPAQPTN
ncbi:hypothetical protein HYV87_01355 [Candidatus Woesearchaeota archaeon]|nr:hypothetical protein [Candidatus Woesearchaeota archaeon]MBI2581761.1 hypothetical protein [Candidatus Woesearchaeota archaeon]